MTLYGSEENNEVGYEIGNNMSIYVYFMSKPKWGRVSFMFHEQFKHRENPKNLDKIY
jgi:hypothetical protein